MKFLIDAQLPLRLSLLLGQMGHDSVHTLEMPDKNYTTDAQIIRYATSDSRIVVTKDADFVTTHLLHTQPPRLLLISTGNIRNNDLIVLVSDRIGAIDVAFDEVNFVELTRTGVILHG